MKVYNNTDGSTGRISTSKGNQLKFEVGNKWYKADFLGYEGASEYLASVLLQHSNVEDFVVYKLFTLTYNEHPLNGCVSDSFLREGETLVTADRLLSAYDPDYYFHYEKMGIKEQIQQFVQTIETLTHIQNFGAYLTQLLEFDQLILNEDRHFNNIAFLMDEKGNFRPSPVFDNGAAYLSDMRDSYPLERDIYGAMASVEAKPFHGSFDKQVEICQSLYGSQLQLDKDVSVENAISHIRTQYGDKIANRIQFIYDRQKYLYPEYYTLDMEQERLHEDNMER